MRYTRMALAAGLMLTANVAMAQLQSNTPTVTLNATQNATLQLTTSAATTSATGPINGAGVTPFAPLDLTANWNLGSAASVVVVGWFASPTAALSSGSNNIPSSAVEGRTGSATFAPFNQNDPTGMGVAGASRALWTVAAGAGVGNATTNLNLQLNLASAPPAGSYTGTLNLRAITQ